jgi:peptidoglycan/xylan/chitin deacetylase (PgdA/CDA1 family)
MDFTLCYPGFKKRAITFSYDDGILQDRKLVELFNHYGLKATFNLNPGRSGVAKFRRDKDNQEIDCSHLNLAESISLYAGHEISNHTFSHPHLEELPLSEQKDEFSKGKEALEALTGKPVLGAAYPYGTYNADTLKALGSLSIRYARTTRSTYQFALPSYPLCWAPTIHHNDPVLNATFSRFLTCPDELPLFYVWGHSYEFAVDHGWETFEAFLSQVVKENDLYSGTGIDILDYTQAARMVYYRQGVFVNPSNYDIDLLVRDDHLRIPKGGNLSYDCQE